ncbi:hypothetical protein ES703_118823 [subsurface metagenome]
MEYSYTEVISPENDPVLRDGEIGGIVSTGFTNYATPLIRYKIGDFVRYKDSKCSCGRQLPLIKSIEGREQELIVTGKGNLISMTAINMHSGVFDNVKQFQFYQDTPGKVIFKVVKKNNYSDEDTIYITRIAKEDEESS